MKISLTYINLKNFSRKKYYALWSLWWIHIWFGGLYRF